MHCPECSTELNVTHRQGIEIDCCPQCRGVWLNRGELDKILARCNSEEYFEDNGQARNQEESEGRPYDSGSNRHPSGRHGPDGFLDQLFYF